LSETWEERRLVAEEFRDLGDRVLVVCRTGERSNEDQRPPDPARGQAIQHAWSKNTTHPISHRLPPKAIVGKVLIHTSPMRDGRMVSLRKRSRTVDAAGSWDRCSFRGEAVVSTHAPDACARDEKRSPRETAVAWASVRDVS
jgi:hypothetical protein